MQLGPHAVVEGQATALGEAHTHGTVVLSWPDVLRGGMGPNNAHNVVFHEFAHVLDRTNGAVDGTPLLSNRKQHKQWVDVMTGQFQALQAELNMGAPAWLDTYAARSPAEFFAVATEAFFQCPLLVREGHPLLYDVLVRYFRLDPAAWSGDGEDGYVM